MAVTRRMARVCDGIRRSSGIRYSEKNEKYYGSHVVNKWDYSIENIKKKGSYLKWILEQLGNQLFIHMREQIAFFS